MLEGEIRCWSLGPGRKTSRVLRTFILDRTASFLYRKCSFFCIVVVWARYFALSAINDTGIAMERTRLARQRIKESRFMTYLQRAG